MADGKARLSREEVLLLRALAMGRPVDMPSTHRLRLEMLGLILDKPGGLRLTARGHRRAQQGSIAEPNLPPLRSPTERDRLGRRKGNRRISPF